MLETQKRQHLVAVKKSLGIGNSSGTFTLTEAAARWRASAWKTISTRGPAPVPLYQYAEVVRLQK